MCKNWTTFTCTEDVKTNNLKKDKNKISFTKT